MASTIGVTPRVVVGPSSLSLYKPPHQNNQYSASNSLKFSHGSSNPKYNYSNLRPLTITTRSVRCAAKLGDELNSSKALIQDAFTNAVTLFTGIGRVLKHRCLNVDIFFYDEDGRIKKRVDRIISKELRTADEVHKCIDKRIDCLSENNEDRCWVFSMSYEFRGILGLVLAHWKASEIIRASLEHEDTEVVTSSSSSSSDMVVKITQLSLLLDYEEKAVIDESSFGGIRSREDLRDLLQFLNSPELEIEFGRGYCYRLGASKEKLDKIKGCYTHVFV